MIYINGVLTSVIKSANPNGFTIESENLVIDSSNCDIDLYKLRVYSTNLSVMDIVNNYAVDFESVETYDQNQLVDFNRNTNEY